MFYVYITTLAFYFVIEDVTCIEKRLLTSNQNDLQSILEKLESMFAKAQERIYTLERKVNNSIQDVVGFTACHSNGSTLAVLQTVLYDHVITNLGNAYNVRDGEFNAPYDGLYIFFVTVMAYSDTDMYLNFMKNGAFVHRIYSNSGYADTSSFSINLYLQAGDTVWLVNGGYATDRLHPGNYNCFSGMLVKQR